MTARAEIRYLEQDCGYETPCWVWQLARNHHGYDIVRDGISRIAHRVYWERENRPVPDGLQLDNLCQNRSCVRPSHLEPVTNTENARRGRKSKLTLAAAREIRHLLANSQLQQRDIAEMFGVTQENISSIGRNQSWKEEEA